ncbi:hypothetical protein Poly21_32050 [Allorhodopirellula heiligendammensis]|uniref:Uncharacterized protein n=1 Tax=Allorhodopirellula heiligendammensis TaxID=2714739 RepID=A0A5C6BWW2_9BACT|nr:hypothetical protein Poly21_32050 [Allorhodopirellula heiligendammensis]
METETEGDVIWHHSISRWTLAPVSSPETRCVKGTGADTRQLIYRTMSSCLLNSDICRRQFLLRECVELRVMRRRDEVRTPVILAESSSSEGPSPATRGAQRKPRGGSLVDDVCSETPRRECAGQGGNVGMDGVDSLYKSRKNIATE